VPKATTVDNGTQFDAETFKDFCDRIGTKIHFASVRHPESNGLVERANGIIMTGIMKLIFNQPRGKWPDELIKVVWSHNTTVSRSTGFTPFKLLFGDEAITPEEAKTGSIRTTASAEDEADYQITKDTIEGTRLQAIEHINKYQAKTIRWREESSIEKHQARSFGASESGQPRYSGQVTTEVGRSFSGSIFVKTRFFQIEGYGQQ
jgi:transposase InsO family protein